MVGFTKSGVPKNSNNSFKVNTIPAFHERSRKGLELRGVNEALAVGDLFNTTHLQALAALDDLHELGGLHEALEGASVEPGRAAVHDLDAELAAAQVLAVDVSDFVLAARRGLEVGGDVDDLVVVEVQSGDRVVALGLCGFFFDRKGFALRVKLDHAVALGVAHGVGKHDAALRVGRGLEDAGHLGSVKDVVAQNQRHRVVANEVAAEHEGLRQTVGLVLHRVLEAAAELRTVAQKLVKQRRVVRRRDEQDFANSGLHQGRKRVVNHRLIVHRHELLADAVRERMESGAGTAGQDDAFHR